MTEHPLAADLAVLTRRLTEAVTAECCALIARRFDQLQDLITAKLQLARAYEELSARLGPPEALSEPSREILRAPTWDLRAALDRHAVVVAASRTVAERLIKSVTGALGDQARPVLSYGPKAGLRNASAAPAAFAVNACA